MSWGVDLWDQIDRIADHTQKGIEFIERYNEFVKERCKIEAAYAKDLKRLVKSYQPKKKEDDDEGFTCIQSFNEMLKEMNSIACQHEEVVDCLQQGVMKSLQTAAAELKIDRKKNLEEARKLQAQLEAQHAGLLKAKKKYEVAFKDSEKAEDAYKRADDDINLSRAEVEKARLNSIQKSQICTGCKSEYASVLEKTNQFQRDYFARALPQIYDQLQLVDEKRCTVFKQQLQSSAQCTKAVLPIIASCLESILTASDRVQPTVDTKMVIEKYKSGFNPPDDVPFEDFGDESSGSRPTSQAAAPAAGGSGGSETPSKPTNGSSAASTGGKSATMRSNDKKNKERAGISRIFNSKAKRSLSLRLPGVSPKVPASRRGTVDGSEGDAFGTPTTTTAAACSVGSSGRHHRRLRSTGQPDEPREDFSHLPPQQQKKQLQKKIKELEHQLNKENSEREGMLKMQEVYKGNPNLGDARLVGKQLEDNQTKLEALKAELRKFEVYRKQAEGSMGDSGEGTPGLQRKSSVSSHQSTGSSGCGGTTTDGATPIAGRPLSHLGGAHPMPPDGAELPATDAGCRNDSDVVESSVVQSSVNHHDSFEDPPPYGSEVGRAIARYSFEPTSEGSIAMRVDEAFAIVEPDQGDGWTRVRRLDGKPEEGFVPTSYIAATFY